MQNFFTGTIRRVIIVAVVLSALPPFVMLLYSGMHRYQAAHDDVTRRGLRVVESIAERQDLITGNAFTILTALLKVGALRDFSAESGSRLFRGVVSEYPFFSNIFIMSPSGAVISSAGAVPDGMSLSGTSLHSVAARTKGPTLVSVAPSPFTGFPVMQAALPVEDRQGTVFGYLCAELRLSFLDRILAGQHLPAGAAVYMLSGTGQLMLSSLPEPPVRVGRNIGEAIWNGLEKAAEAGGYFTYTQTGREMLAVYRRSTLEGSFSPYLYTVMTVPQDAAYGWGDYVLRRDALLLAVGAFFSLAAGLFLGFYGVARPVGVLLDVAVRLARGDRKARIAEDAGLRGEFAALGEEFNAMAGALEERGEALERDRETAARSSRAKSEFLANMSHEIRTPMNAILGMAHLVGKTALTSSQTAQVDKIRAAADSLLALLNNILDYSKLEAGKMLVERIPFHMGRLLNNVRASCTAAARETGARLVTTIAADAPPVLLGDPTRLSQALVILLEEAVRRSGGGAVSIGTDSEEWRDGGMLVRFSFTVSDVPLDDGLLAGIRDALGGQGALNGRLDNEELRLMLAGGIMRVLGGDAVVEGLPNGFRLSASALLGVPESIPEDATLRFDGERVLLLSTRPGEQPVDLVRRTFRDLLSRYNLRAEECDGVDEGAALLREADAKGTPFTLVIADMPDSLDEAVEYLERLKHGIALSRPPLLVLTANNGVKRLPPELARSGIDAFLPRPVNESLLVNTLSGLIRERRGHAEQGGPDGIAAGQRVDGLRVLLVEDNAVNVEIAEEILKSAGALVVSAGNGREAIGILEERPADFDVVLMDLEMPVMTGIEATGVIRGEKGLRPWRLPIIAMTAHNSADEVSACLEAGMNDHCLKPIVVAQLFATLRRWTPASSGDREPARRIMRKMRHILMRSHAGDPELRGLMASLEPLLGEGRVTLLKDMLDRQDPDQAYAMLDDYLNDPGEGGE